MRVAFLTNRTTRASLPVLNALSDSQSIELCHIFFLDTLAQARSSPAALIKQFGLLGVVSRIGRQVHSRLRTLLGRTFARRWIRATSAYELAVLKGFPYSFHSDMNTPETIDFLKTLAPNVLVVCVCKNILRPPILSIESTHFVNIHPSLLPKYRGPMPTFWMRYHGEEHTGVTIHKITAEIDAGTILAQRSVPLDYGKSELQLELEVFELAAEILAATLDRLVHNEPPLHFSTEAIEASYHSYPTAADRMQLKTRLSQPSCGT